MYIMCVVFVQRFEPRGRRFTNFHDYYYFTAMHAYCVLHSVCLQAGKTESSCCNVARK